METCPICGEPRPEAAASTPSGSEGTSTGTSNAYGAGPAAAPHLHNMQDTPRTAPYPPASSSYPAVPTAEEPKGGTAPLVLGILSLVIPYVGIVLGILALVFGSGAKKTNPIGSANYSLGQAGWVLGLIGLVFQAILIAYLTVAFSMIFQLIDEMSSYGGYGFNGYNPFF